MSPWLFFIVVALVGIGGIIVLVHVGRQYAASETRRAHSLLEAIRRGDLAEIRHRAPLDAMNFADPVLPGHSLLDYAVQVGQADAAALLVELGATPSRYTEWYAELNGRTPEQVRDYVLSRQLGQLPSPPLPYRRTPPLSKTPRIPRMDRNTGLPKLTPAQAAEVPAVTSDLIELSRLIRRRFEWAEREKDPALTEGWSNQLRAVELHTRLRGHAPNVFAQALKEAAASTEHPRRVLLAAIRLGFDDASPTLVALLHKHGTRQIAADYLNSGEQQLEEAARTWAFRNGFKTTVFDKPFRDVAAVWGRFAPDRGRS